MTTKIQKALPAFKKSNEMCRMSPKIYSYTTVNEDTQFSEISLFILSIPFFVFSTTFNVVFQFQFFPKHDSQSYNCQKLLEPTAPHITPTYSIDFFLFLKFNVFI